MTAPADVWDSAENPQLRTSSDYYGQVKIDAWPCVLVKGTGKLPFDPALHTEDQRRTAVDMMIIPLAEMNVSWDVSRNLIAESREWASIVLPSIKSLGISLRELNGRWAHVTLEETGQTYTGRDGATRSRTTFKFLAVYNTEAECRAAYQAASGAGTPAPATPANGNGNGNGNAKERETALKFARLIVENACRGQSDLSVILKAVEANMPNFPVVTKHFTASSPEIADLIAEQMSKTNA